MQQSHSETPKEQIENSPVLYGNLPYSPPHSSCNQESTPDSQIADVLPDEFSAHFRAHAANVGEQQSITSLDWLIDSGCTNHMFFNKQHFDDYRAYKAGIIIADNTTVAIAGRETIEMKWLLPDGSSNLIRLDNVLHVPQLKCELFLISQATRKGLGVVFFDDAYQITKDNIAIGYAPKVNNTYILNISQLSTQIARLIKKNFRALVIDLSFNEEAVKLWHRRIGYLNETDLKRLITISSGISLL